MGFVRIFRSSVRAGFMRITGLFCGLFLLHAGFVVVPINLRGVGHLESGFCGLRAFSAASQQ